MIRLPARVCCSCALFVHRPQKEDLVQFVLHASLDALDAKVWGSQTMFFKNVDKFNDVNISAFVTAGREDTQTQQGGRKGNRGRANVRRRTGSKNEMMSSDSGRPAAGWARLVRQRDCFSRPRLDCLSHCHSDRPCSACAWLCRHALPVAARPSQGRQHHQGFLLRGPLDASAL